MTHSKPPADDPAAGAERPPALPKTLRSLQVLRAFAAFVVVVGHVLEAAQYRYVDLYRSGLSYATIMGVDVFFCLSGFLMYYTSEGDFAAPGAWRSFLTRRALRIYPIYWVATLATLAAVYWPGSHVTMTGSSPAYVAKSFLLLPQSTGPVILQAWTLVHEVRFYAVFGLLLVLCRGPALAVLTLWGAASLAVLVVSYANQPMLDSGLAARALTYLCHPASLEFALGVWAARIVRRRATPLWLDRLLLPAAAALTLAIMYWFQELKPEAKYYTVTMFAAPSFLLVLGAALAERRWPRLPIPAVAVALGDASYSTYLIHKLILYPVVYNLFPASPSPAGLAAWVWVLVAAIHAAGWLVHVTTERPLHRLAQRLTRRPPRRPDGPVAAVAGS